MFPRTRQGAEDDDEGFTLIELLVVIIIIGVLASIAIPVFLNQRKKAYDAQAKSDIKNASTAEETYFSDYNAYTANTAALPGYAKSANAGTVAIVIVPGSSGATGTYMLTSLSDSGDTFCFNSASVGVGVTKATSC